MRSEPNALFAPTVIDAINACVRPNPNAPNNVKRQCSQPLYRQSVATPKLITRDIQAVLPARHLGLIYF